MFKIKEYIGKDKNTGQEMWLVWPGTWKERINAERAVTRHRHRTGDYHTRYQVFWYITGL